MREVDKIIEKIKEVKPELENSYFITEIGVFGSYVRDEQKQDSDIDVLIDYKRGMTLFTIARLENFLAGILGKKVDIAFKRSLKPRIGKRILSEVIYV